MLSMLEALCESYPSPLGAYITNEYLLQTTLTRFICCVNLHHYLAFWRLRSVVAISFISIIREWGSLREREREKQVPSSLIKYSQWSGVALTSSSKYNAAVLYFQPSRVCAFSSASLHKIAILAEHQEARSCCQTCTLIHCIRVSTRWKRGLCCCPILCWRNI